MKAITRWPANKMSAAYRRKRFVRAAFIRAWSRVLGVISALVGVVFFTQHSPARYWAQVVAVLVALCYLWMDVHYEAKRLQRRHQRAAERREEYKLMRSLQA